VHIRTTLPLLLSFCLLAAGCPAEENNANNDPTPDVGGGADAGADADPEVDADGADSGDADGGEPGDPCTFQNDCAEDEVCAAGRCAPAPACDGISPGGLRQCTIAIRRLDPDAVDRAYCDGSACRVACVHDTDCASGEQCTDYGACRPFTGQITGDRPGGDARAPLQAGVGNELLNFPVGIALGGFGNRGELPGRYAESLGASQGQAHGLYARAVLLDNGERQMMFIRLPIIFPTAALHEAVARQLQERTGKDWRDSLVISGTHTHSGPGRFLQLPTSTGIDLGIVGTDRFRQEAFDWLVESTSRAAGAALDDLSPARLGWKIVESFDNDDEISSDRWGATPPFDDNRMLLIRVDDMNGDPRALMFSFGTHGTFYDSDYASGDSAAAAERGLEARFGQEYGKFVPTLFFNENGGSMSPRGDRRGHREFQRFEYYGHQLAERSWGDIESIQTDTDVALSGVSLRFPMTYEGLGYQPGEFRDILTPSDLKYGGFQCSVADAEDGDYETYADTDEVKCLSIANLLFNRTPNQFLTATISALEIDGLTMVTIPGEITMELGWQVLRDVQTAHGVDPLSAWVLGYAQDHHFYLTPGNLRGPLPPFSGISLPKPPEEYNDYAISYFQGGYEPSFSLWGWRMGDFLVERAIEAVARLKGDDTPPEYFEPLPLAFTPIEHEDEWVIGETDPSTLGQEVLAPPATANRLSPIEYGFVGGDPGAEAPQAPQVTLMREVDGGAWEPVLAPNTRPYDNREPYILTRVRETDAGAWEWVVYWEELKDFPTGNYRFDVVGHYLDAEDGRQQYSASSSVFALAPSDALVPTVDVSGDTVSGTLSYPTAARLAYIGGTSDGGAVSGSYRMRHPEVGSDIPDPVLPADLPAGSVTIELKQGGNVARTFTDPAITADRATLSGRDVPVTRYSLDLTGVPSGTYDVEVRVTDAFGNTGLGTGTYTK
jgi:hypothetical protein